MIEFRVYGTPVTWRTAKWTKGRTYKYPPLAHWQDTVALEARKYVDAMTDSPYELNMVFAIERPISHWTKKGRLTARARRDFPACTSLRAGDLTNHRKAVEDALTGVIYCDDSQVIKGFTAKRYAGWHERPGVMIQLRELGDADD